MNATFHVQWPISFNFPMHNLEQQFTHAQTDTIELSTQSKTQFQTNFHSVYKNKADLCTEKKSGQMDHRFPC